jgi:hypothetical protein
MIRKQYREHLARVFTTMQAPEGTRIIFHDEYLRAKEGTEEHAIYRAVSDAQRDSGLGFSFSYNVAYKAVDALCEVLGYYDTPEEALEDGRGVMQDAITAQLPYMNAELAEIVQDVNAWDIVEDALASASGSDDCKLASVLTYAWERAIENMARDILANLAKV